jgi:NitT/TauT family transport system substrate-binding protein
MLAVQLATVACLIGLSCTASFAKELKEVVVGMPTNINAQQGTLTAAMELGYFAEEGISVKMQDFQGAAIVIPQVGAKAILIGSGGGDPLVVGAATGRAAVPVKFFYNQQRSYAWEFVVPENSPINKISDLKGKTIGVGSLSNSHIPVTRLIMKENGLELTKDYKLMAISIGGPAFKALMDGQVDAYNTWTANIAGFEATGTKLKRIPIGDRFKSLFTVGYFAHEGTIKQNPELLAGFGRAVSKGAIVCEVNVDWCVKTFWKYYPNLKPREGDEAENIKRQGKIITGGLVSQLDFPPGKPRRFGEYPEGAWKNFIDILCQGGEIPTDKIDPGTFYTNALVDKMNQFDQEAVAKQALELK